MQKRSRKRVPKGYPKGLPKHVFLRVPFISGFWWQYRTESLFSEPVLARNGKRVFFWGNWSTLSEKRTWRYNKTIKHVKNWLELLRKDPITLKRVPKRSQYVPICSKRSPKGSKRSPKEPKGTQKEPKGIQKEPKRVPKRPQRGTLEAPKEVFLSKI